MRRRGLTITMPAVIVFLVLGVLVLSAESSWQSDRILLEDVRVITLNQGRMTNGRRSSVSQLKCVGGSAQYKFQPQTVQCVNQGSDGNDIQWECKADMDNAYRFGNIQVSCEGYDSPYDPYILKGSCGLEYTIDFTEEGFEKAKQSGGSYSYSKTNQKSEGGLGGLLIYGGILFAIYVIYQKFIKPNQQATPGAQAQGAQPPPYGFRPEFQQPPQGPPPSYESTQQGSPYEHASAPHEHMSDNTNTGSNNRPGFWSGAATGGFMGYMFGSRNRGGGYGNTGWGNRGSGGLGGFGNSEHHHHHHHDSSNQSDSFFSNSRGSSPSPSSGSSGTRTASGFGGTTRR